MTANSTRLVHPKYRADIDGLRAVAVMSVIAFHAFPHWVTGGFIGVDIFFVISGFLISTIILESLGKGTFDIVEFYSRRIRRIFPSLILVLVFCFAFGWITLLADEYKQLGKHIAAGAGFLSNFVLWNEAGYFDNSAETKPLIHLWSLGIEEQFYIFWPLILILVKKPRYIIVLAVALCGLSFYLNILGIREYPVATFYSPFTRIWELLCGSILAWIMLSKAKTSINASIVDASSAVINPEKKAIWNNLISITGCSLLAFGLWQISRDVSFPGKWAVIPVLGTVLVISAGPNAWINRKLLSHPAIVWIGLISFPLYLWHWPILSFARIIESEVPPREVRIAAVLLSIILASITYLCVERPIRFGVFRNFKTIALLVSMTAIGYIGYSVYERDGLDFRSAISQYSNNKNELIRTPTTDDNCLKYIQVASPLFAYCRYSNVGSKETIAVIGDSHAHVAFPGIAEYLKDKGINTVLLANSSCPPFIGSYTGRTRIEKETCKAKVDQILKAISGHDDIKKVIIFTRGPIYTTGTEPLLGDRTPIDFDVFPLTQFAESAQLTIDKLHETGKQIYYVTENPELSHAAEACLGRPFKSDVANCSMPRSSVLERQREYTSAFKNLRNATVIDSLDAFCREENCIAFDEDGALLYADDDHLSVAGSRFQVKHLLTEILN